MGRAIQVESLWNGLRDTSGEPLAGGKVYTYEAGTTTPTNLYTSQDQSTLATNPITLDSNGQAQVYADGVYKFVITDSEDVTLYTRDNLVYIVGDARSYWGGVSTGTSSAYAIDPNPALDAYVDGLAVDFIVHTNNAGACTLNVNSLGAKSIKKGNGTVNPSASDLAEGTIARCYYDATLGVFILDIGISNQNLVDIAGLAVADGNFIVGNGSNFVVESGATARASLGAAKSGDNDDLTSFKVTSSYRLELNEGAVGLLPNANKQINLGADSYRYKTLYTSKITDNGSKVTISSATEVGATNGFYFGDADTDNTWRIIRSGSGLIFERRESGEYKTKFSIASTGGGS